MNKKRLNPLVKAPVVLSKEKIGEYIKSTPKERLEWLKMANRFVRRLEKRIEL